MKLSWEELLTSCFSIHSLCMRNCVVQSSIWMNDLHTLGFSSWWHSSNHGVLLVLLISVDDQEFYAPHLSTKVIVWHKFPIIPTSSSFINAAGLCHEGDFTRATAYFQQLTHPKVRNETTPTCQMPEKSTFGANSSSVMEKLSVPKNLPVPASSTKDTHQTDKHLNNTPSTQLQIA